MIQLVSSSYNQKRPVDYMSTKEFTKKNNVSWSLVRQYVREGKIDVLRIKHGEYNTIWVPEGTTITKRKVGRNWKLERIGNHPKKRFIDKLSYEEIGETVEEYNSFMSNKYYDRCKERKLPERRN